ncbi:hypothetical protein CCS77_0497 [Campylobacter concisus]|uniref:Uncharacterized protein n=1 Tax=Campylobacter concisus TaxID=199 RepID=A0A2R4NYQ3_9BACT|nr:hypothetical protein CCS77_0497 [Campylobacter concisus]
MAKFKFLTAKTTLLTINLTIIFILEILRFKEITKYFKFNWSIQAEI